MTGWGLWLWHMKINVTCWTSKWITWSWWKTNLIVPFHDLLSITPLDPYLTTSGLLPKNFIHSVLPPSKSSNKEQISVFGKQPFITSSAIFFPLKNLQQSWFQTFITPPFYLSLLTPSCQPHCIWNDLSTHAHVQGCSLLTHLANRCVSTSSREDPEQLGSYSAGCSWRSSLKQHLASHLEQSLNLTVQSSFTHWPKQILFPANTPVLVPSNSLAVGFWLPQFRTARGFEVPAVPTTSHAPRSPSSSFWSLSAALCQPSHQQAFGNTELSDSGATCQTQNCHPCFQTVSQNQGIIWFGKDPSRSHGPTTAWSMATSNTGLHSLAQGKREEVKATDLQK